MSMISKLDGILARYEKLMEQASDPAIVSNIEEYKKCTKEISDMQETVDKYKEYKDAETRRVDDEELMSIETDPEMKEMLNEEILELKKKQDSIIEELKVLLIPKDPDDDKNVIVEIRAGAGGEEAALFAYELYRMYVNYAEKNHWKAEEIDSNNTELGGVKEVVFSVTGKKVFAKMKYESGVHRVQRVPETESQGRIQTSTATVAVLPEAKDVEIKIEDKDLRVDTYRSSGAGGQHINKTESCIRLTHLPTGIVVTCQDERSQIKNREKAMMVLKSRLYDLYQGQNKKEYDDNRKSQIGTGDRSEKIRTYNFPQGRVTDHRIGLSLFNIEKFIMGDIDEMTEALAIADKEAKLLKEEDDQ